MPALPSVTCPRCRRASEYQATIEMIEPPVGKIDIGYCGSCQCLFEQVRSTGTAYDSTSWPPVCRTCRQPVIVEDVEGSGAAQIVRFRCRDHHERWQWNRRDDHWVRVG